VNDKIVDKLQNCSRFILGSRTKLVQNVFYILNLLSFYLQFAGKQGTESKKLVFDDINGRWCRLKEELGVAGKTLLEATENWKQYESELEWFDAWGLNAEKALSNGTNVKQVEYLYICSL